VNVRRARGPHNHSTYTHNRAAMLHLCALAMGLLLGAGAHAQPVPSFLLDTARVVGLDHSNAWATSADFGDSLGLVVWVGSDGGQVRGCRVRRDMSVIDSICLDISGPDYFASASEQHAVDVAWSDQNCLAVWFGGTGLCGSLVSSQGEIIRRLVIGEPGGAYSWVSVATDGSSYLVAWEQGSGESTRQMYRLVSGDGTPIDSARRVSWSSGNQSSGDVESSDSCYMVAFWRNDGQGEHVGLSAVRIRPDGSLLDSVPIPIREGATSLAPTVGCIADKFYVAWGEGQDSTDIRFARITQDGMLMDSGGVLVGREERILELSSAASRETCLLAWISLAGDTCHVRARRIDGSAHPLDSTSVEISLASRAPISPCGINVSAPADFAVTWCQVLVSGTGIRNERDVACRRVASSGIVVDSTDRGLSYAANTQILPDVASDGQNFLAVWEDVRKSSPLAMYLRLARFSSDGARLDSISVTAGDTGASVPAVAYGAGCYMLSWHQSAGRKIEATRVSSDGVVLDTLPIIISNNQSTSDQVDIAFGDSVFLVVWNKGANGVFGARVHANGVLLDSVPKPMGMGGNFCFWPRVAGEGRDFLVTHLDDRRDELRAIRVNSEGVFMDTVELPLGRVSGGNLEWSAPAAFGAGVYMVYDWGGSRTWRISRDGVLLDSVTGLGLGGHSSSIAFDGTDFMVIGWGSPYTMVGQRISPSGVLLDPSPIELTTVIPGVSEISAQLGCAMAANSSRKAGVVFTGYERPGYMSYRVRAAAFPVVAIADARPAPLSEPRPRATFVHGVLFLPETTSLKPQAARLLDISGRKVLDLRPGANDVRALAPGVYFVRQASGAEREASCVTKIVVTR
jgi:hypothetical protein